MKLRREKNEKKCGFMTRQSAKKTIILMMLSIALLFVTGLNNSRMFTQETLAEGEVKVKGLSLRVEPVSLTVPINTVTVVNTIFSVDTAELLAGMVVKAELRGPGLDGAITLSTLPNHPFSIPGLSIKGNYYLEDIRLEREGLILLKAVPQRVAIAVMDIVVTRIETRQLTLEEIRERGIVITDDSFTCYNFSVGFILESKEVTYNFPVIFGAEGMEVIRPTGLTVNNVTNPIAELGSSGGGMVPFTLELPDIDIPVPGDIGGGNLGRSIPGILVFNNDIAFLNQFFSVMFVISNNAPDSSSLSLKNLQARLILPDGLREAETNPPHIIGTPIPVRAPGPDGKIGTSDDIDIILATFSGMAEFLAEGLQEGAHTVEIEFSGTLSGLPSGDVEVKGKAAGAVIVRSPEFSVTFSHPSVVRNGEEYDIYVTMTNISPVTANLVSLSMPASNLVGTRILSAESVGFETLTPGESKTAEFRMLSLQTGEVRASAFKAEGNVKGKFILYAGVGEEGIPLSPDTITLPRYAYSLPKELINTALQLLGEAYSIATTPPGGLPEGLPYVSKGAVTSRALDLAEAGQRVFFGEELLKSIEVLALDWQGSRRQDLSFDTLRRLTSKGTTFAARIAAVFDQYLIENSAAAFFAHFSQTCSYKNPFFAAQLSFSGRPRSASLKVTDFYRNELSNTGASLTRQIPYGEFYLLEESSSPVDFALIGAVEENGYTVEITGLENGTFDLSLLVPDAGNGFNQVFFSGIACEPGSRSILTLKGGDTAFTLTTDLDGDGAADRTHQAITTHVNESGLRLISAVQDCETHGAGHAVALLFNHPVEPDTAKVRTNFSSAGKEVYGSYLQPSGRVIIVGFNNPVSPFVESRIKVENLLDRAGNLLTPAPTEMLIEATIDTPGGIVYGRVLTADGQPVVNAPVQLSEQEDGSTGAGSSGTTRSFTVTDASGNYQFDYVRILSNPFTIETLDPASGKLEKVRSKLWVNGQRALIDIIIRGRGSLSGRVLTEEGVPVGNAAVGAKAENAGIEESFSTKSDENGSYLLSDIPIGRINLFAASGTLYGSASAALTYPGESARVDITLVGVNFGSVKGRVLKNDGLTPVIDTPVVVNTGAYGGQSTRTDGEGYFNFPNVPAGWIVVQAYDPFTGKIGGKVETTLIEGQEFDASIILRGTGGISGTVLSYNGVPQPGILVYMENTNFYMDTDTNGEFSFSEVPVGNYSLTAYDRTARIIARGAANITVEGQEIRSTIVFADPRKGGVTGKVYQPDGVTTAADARVYVSDGAYRVLAQTSTGSSGSYAFSDLPPAQYYVTAVTAGNGSTSNAVIRFPGDYPTSNIYLKGSGKVNIDVFAEDGQTGIMADVKFSYTTFVFEPGHMIGFQMKQGRYSTDENGHLEFDGVMTGPFGGNAANPFYPREVYFNGRLETPGAVENVKVVMPPLGRIEGRVVSYEKDEAGEDIPVPNAKVTLRIYDFPEQTLYSSSTPGQEGSFTFNLIPTGGFYIEAQSGPEEMPEFFYQGKASSHMGETGETVNITVRLQGKGQVTGFVKRPDGTVVPDAKVNLETIGFPFYKKELRSQPAAGAEPGLFIFNFVPQGNFFLRAVDDKDTFLGGRAYGSMPTHGYTADVDVLLEASGTVQGRVLSPDYMSTIASAQVVLYSGASGYPFGFAVSGADGAFKFVNAAVGTFRVEVLDAVSGRRGKANGSLSADGDIADIDVNLEGRGTVSGAFYDASQADPISGAEVKIASLGQFPFDMVTTTGSDGSFNFGEIGAGGFKLEALDPGTKLIGKAEGAIEYEKQDVVVNIYAEGSGKARGTVLQAGGQEPVPLAPVILRIDGKVYSSSTANDRGQYVFDLVPLGDFTLRAGQPGGGPDYGTASGSLTYHGQETVIDIVFKGTGSITGRVLDGSGTPQAAVNVKLYANNTLTTTGTDSSGNFIFSPVLLGRFSLQAKDTVSNLSAAGSGEITSPGETVTIDLTLQSAGQVKGKVLNTDGSTPADKAYVHLKGGDLNLYTSTDTSGNFQFDAVRLGDFTVVIEGYNQSGLGRVGGAVNTHGDVVDFGAVVLDNQKPQVTSLFPADGSSGVPLRTAVTLIFSESIAPHTVNSNNIRVTANTGLLSGTLSLSGDQKTVVFTSYAPLRSFTLYTVTVAAAVEDSAGNTLSNAVSGTFITSDTEPPRVIAVSPVPNAAGVSPAAVIRVTFNEPIDTSKFTGGNMVVTKAGSPIAGSFGFNESSTAVIFTPASSLEKNALYTVSVQNALDLTGNIQAAPYSSAFYTTDTISPELQLIPPDGSTSVIEGSSVHITTNTASTDIADVYFYIEGEHTFTDSSTPFDYVFTAPLISEIGKTTFLVEALPVDSAGNQGEKKNLLLTLIPDSPPQVTLTLLSPAVLDPGQQLRCRVNASDDYRLKKVVFTAKGGSLDFLDGDVLNQPTYAYDFAVRLPADILPGTEITAQASAMDSRENTAITAQVSIKVREDTAAPTVQIISPAEGDMFKFNETVEITASAADDIAIKEVRFYLDDELLTADSSAPYQAAYTVPELEDYKQVIFRAEAEDIAGKTNSDQVNVTLEKLIDENAPVVKILSPTGGALVFAGENLKIIAHAVDNEGIEQVEFYVDGQLLFTDTTVPYETQYTIPASAVEGTAFTIKAVAGDLLDNSTYRQSVVQVVEGVHLPGGTVIEAGDKTYDNQTIIIKEGTVIINGAHIFANVLVKESGWLRHSPATSLQDYKMELTLSGQLVIGPDAKIAVGARGYLGGYRSDNNQIPGLTSGNTTTGASGLRSGGSHGGYGGQYSPNPVNELYGSIYQPTIPGSGGGAYDSGYPGGSGGGVLYVQAAEIITDGSIGADGEYSSRGGAGGGGSIYFHVTTLKGSGTIHADGGINPTNGSAGGGGRIAVYYTDAAGFDQSKITAFGGTFGDGTINTERNGSAGTVYLEKSGAAGQILVNNRGLETSRPTGLIGGIPGVPGTITAIEAFKLTDARAHFIPGSLTGMELFPNIEKDRSFTIIDNTETGIYTDEADGSMIDPLPGETEPLAKPGDRYRFKYKGVLILEECQTTLSGSHSFGDITLIASTLTVNGLLNAQNLTLQSGSTITHSPATTTVAYSLEIEARQIVVSEGCNIGVSGHGYLGGFMGDNASSYGLTLGLSPGSYRYSGGSYGGYGGQYGSDAVNRIYGSLSAPIDPGSGSGAYSSSYPGGAGGGVIRISAENIVNDGGIRANGGSAASGGSGGSIRINVGILSGSGEIRADGGGGLRSQGSGGSGGRIALYYEDASAFEPRNITAYGGLYLSGSDGEKNGSAGTVYLKKAAEQAQLIVDNRGKASHDRRVFPVFGPGTVTSISGTEGNILVDENAVFMPGALVGMELIPDITDKEKTFTIIANDRTTITTDPADGSLTQASAAGKTYSGKFVFPGHLVIRNAYSRLDREVELGSLSVIENGRLSHPLFTTSETHYISVKAAGKILVEDGSMISVSTCGYLGGYRGDNNSPYGRTLGNIPGSYYNSGAGHGGAGGIINTGNQVNDLYGSLYRPVDAGSGGGGISSGPSYTGSGGGVIILSANEIENNGEIRANGGIGSQGGAGAGGSVFIQAGTLKGSGLIQARGGNSSSGGAGGGGRIALYYEDVSQSDLSKLTAFGGIFTGGTNADRNGGAGTLYLKKIDVDGGELIIDNNNIACRDNSTSLPAVAKGAVLLSYDTLNGSELIDDDAVFLPGALVGVQLNPAPAGMVVFPISGNNSTIIFTDPAAGDMTLQGSGTYTGEHHLKSITVKGKSRVFTYDRIIVPGPAAIIIEAGSTLVYADK